MCNVRAAPFFPECRKTIRINAWEKIEGNIVNICSNGSVPKPSKKPVSRSSLLMFGQKREGALGSSRGNAAPEGKIPAYRHAQNLSASNGREHRMDGPPKKAKDRDFHHQTSDIMCASQDCLKGCGWAQPILGRLIDPQEVDARVALFSFFFAFFLSTVSPVLKMTGSVVNTDPVPISWGRLRFLATTHQPRLRFAALMASLRPSTTDAAVSPCRSVLPSAADRLNSFPATWQGCKRVIGGFRHQTTTAETGHNWSLQPHKQIPDQTCSTPARSTNPGRRHQLSIKRLFLLSFFSSLKKPIV